MRAAHKMVHPSHATLSNDATAPARVKLSRRRWAGGVCSVLLLPQILPSSAAAEDGAAVATPSATETSSVSATATPSAPEEGAALVAPPKPDTNVYTILRVQEATLQEERLINSGKFKDLQRANIKLAVEMILSNYRIGDAVVGAIKLVPQERTAQAQQVGNEAIDALQLVLDFFDSDANSLQVTKITSEKQTFALKALGKARERLSAVLGLVPEEAVAKARAFIEYENALNKAEFMQANPGEKYLNPPPV